MSRESLADNGQCVACYRFCDAYICEECCFDSAYVGARAYWDDHEPRVDQPTHVARMRRKRQEATTAYEHMRDLWGSLDHGVVPAEEIGRQSMGKNALPTGLGSISRSARVRKMERDANHIYRKALNAACDRIMGPSRRFDGSAFDGKLRREESKAFHQRRGLRNLGKCFAAVGWALLDELTRPG